DNKILLRFDFPGFFATVCLTPISSLSSPCTGSVCCTTDSIDSSSFVEMGVADTTDCASSSCVASSFSRLAPQFVQNCNVLSLISVPQFVQNITNFLLSSYPSIIILLFFRINIVIVDFYKFINTTYFIYICTFY